MTAPETIAGFESPSLAPPGAAGSAYELKFLIDETVAHEVTGWARRHLAADPHGDRALDGAYRTTSLYFDTPELDVYRRTEQYKGHKFRVRRYGSSPWVYLERKSRHGARVEKRRSAVAEDDLPLLASTAFPEGRVGRWFHNNLRVNRLQPACRVTYARWAFAGTDSNGSIRLTLDRYVRGVLTDEWGLGRGGDGAALLDGRAILELKFHAALPALFEGLARELGLSPAVVSKYRLCRGAWAGEIPGKRGGAAPRN